MSVVKAKISTVISEQFPEFVREDHGTFVSFLEAYYEFLSQTEDRSLESLKDIDETLNSFVQYISDEVMSQIPQTILADRRLVAKRIKDLYLSKGNEKSFSLLFRLLYNESVDVYLPKDDILRASDGKFNKDTVLRIVDISNQFHNFDVDTFELIGKRIFQNGNTATAEVENVIKFQYQNLTITELKLATKTVTGTFNTTGYIFGESNKTTGRIIYGQVKPGITNLTLEDPGLYYQIGDKIRLSSPTGEFAVAQVTRASTGGIKDIQVEFPGSGYQINQEIAFDNTDAGTGLGDSLVTARAIVTALDNNSLLLENGDFLLKEDATEFLFEGTLTGGIKTVKVLDSGQNYKKLPVVSCKPTQLLGEEAKLVAISEDIGKVLGVSIYNPGIDYQNNSLGFFPTNLIFKRVDGEFALGELVTAEPQSIALETSYDVELSLEDGSKFLLEKQEETFGYISFIDKDRNFYRLDPASVRFEMSLETGDRLVDEDGDIFVLENSGPLRPNMTLVGQATGAVGKVASGTSTGSAFAKGTLSAVYKTPGNFINADGKISDSSKKIQDSAFYQEYSYQLRSFQSINDYRDIVRKLLHPVGMALWGSLLHEGFGQAIPRAPLSISFLRAVIRSFISNKIKAMGNYYGDGQTFPEILKSEFTLIIVDFLQRAGGHMILIPTNPEFLPEIEVPRFTPEEIHMMDLRVDAAHGDEWFYILLYLDMQCQVHRQTEIIMEPVGHLDLHVRGFGPCWDSLEKFKFTLPPFAAGIKGHWGNTPRIEDVWQEGTFNYYYWRDENEYYGNTQNGHFANVVIGDVINNPYRKINFCVDSWINIIRPLPYTYDSTTTTYDSTSYTNDLTYPYAPSNQD
jgi:hypothetical protein